MTKIEHGDVYYNRYDIPAGKWLVCKECGFTDVLFSHQQSYDLGWTHDLCPDCK